MTDLLYLTDAYLRSCQATVTAVAEDGRIAVDRTVFYVQGGGQPADHGSISGDFGQAVIGGVRRADGEVWHFVDDGPLPSVGALNSSSVAESSRDL